MCNNSPRPKLSDRRPSGRPRRDVEAGATWPAGRSAWRTGRRTGATRPRPRPVPSWRNPSCREVSVPGWWPRRTRGICRCYCCCCYSFCCCCQPRPRPQEWRPPRCSSRPLSDKVRVPRRPATYTRPVCLASPSSDGLFLLLVPSFGETHIRWRTKQYTAGRQKGRDNNIICTYLNSVLIIGTYVKSRKTKKKNHSKPKYSCIGWKCTRILWVEKKSKNAEKKIKKKYYPARTHGPRNTIGWREDTSRETAVPGVFCVRSVLCAGTTNATTPTSGEYRCRTLPVWRENQCCQRRETGLKQNIITNSSTARAVIALFRVKYSRIELLLLENLRQWVGT